MFGDDPLEDWLYYREGVQEESVVEYWERAREQLTTGMIKLQDILDTPTPKRTDYYNIGISPYVHGLIVLRPEDLADAHELYHRVLETGGTGTKYVQEGLLKAIATSANPISIPFWQQLLDIKRPRDSFAKTRRNLALAALAFLSISQQSAATYDALLTATRHGDPTIRGLAVHYLGRAYRDAERTLPPDIQTHVLGIATHDKAFLPRFNARTLLADSGLAVPIDNPDGVYDFKVKFMGDKRIYRTIEVRSNQTLEDLHAAIQRAMRWDNDHLYSFFLDGQRYDDTYRFVSPWEEEGPRFTTEAVIGELGLTPKHKFLYYFDYGDSHEFEIEVVTIHPQAEPGNYPRVVDQKGKAPAQYHSWEEEEEYEEDYDEDEDEVMR